MYRIRSFLLAFLLFLFFTGQASASSHCEFILGFNTLRDLIGHEIVGACVENEYWNEIGDSNQQTTGGLMAWRKADNWTAFTDGYRTWINGPNGLVQRLNTERFLWEADYAEVVLGIAPTPTPTPTPAPQPITITGSGRMATELVSVPFPLAILSLRHDGRSNFIVYSYVGDSRDLLVNEIGRYSGRTYLVQGDYLFDIDADGVWQLDITDFDVDPTIAQAGFAGLGDDVSPGFNPPSTGVWSFTHSGESNFIVYAHCAGGSDLLVNEIGRFVGTGVVSFPEGPCFFEVKASGAFAVKPR